MADVATLAEKVASLEQNIQNLTGWQKNQNGAIRRVEDDVKDMSVRVNQKFDAVNANVSQRFDRLLYWMLAQLATLVAGILLLWFGRG